MKALPLSGSEQLPGWEAWGPTLADLLDRHRDEIVVGWVELSFRKLPLSYASQFPRDVQLAALDVAVQEYIDFLRAGAHFQQPEAGLLSPRELFRAGVSPAEVVRRCWFGLEVISPLIRREFPSGSAARAGCFRALEECMSTTLGDFMAAYATEARRQIAEEHLRAATLLDVARETIATLDLDEILRRAAKALQSVAGTQRSIFFLLHENGVTADQISFFDSPSGPTHTTVDLSMSPASRLAADFQKPVSFYDAQTDPRLDAEAALRANVKSVLAVPAIVQGRVVGVATTVTHDYYREFTNQVIELAQGVANVVAPAIENARLHQKVEESAVIRERVRLAREIHDHLAQVLGFLSLKLSSATDSLSEGALGHVYTELMQMAQVVSDAQADLREDITALRTTPLGRGFLATLREYIAEYRTDYGLDVSLAIDDERLIHFTDKTSVQILRVVQEALSNVRKHAEAQTARVSIERKGGEILIAVEDDGRGFHPSVASEGRRHFGLQIMRERAESVGGSVDVISPRQGGTRVLLRVPAPLGGD